MQIRDRIVDFRRVKASDLRPNPKNWRAHPQAQADALRGLLAEVGYVDALMARQLEDGSLMLVDGHLRAETTPDAEVPVLVVDLTEAEADKILLAFDPLAAMAEADQGKLDELLREVETGSEALAAMLDQLAQDNGIVPAEEEGGSTGKEVELSESWQVVVACRSEDEQREIYEHMTAEGFKCRLLAL